MDATLSIILPTYNEAANIVPLIDQLRRAVGDAEIVVVDDDSPDGTWGRVAEAHPGVRLLRRVGQRGLTSAIQDGIQASRGQLVAWMDCDFSTPPEVLPRLIARLDEGFDVAVASRYVPGGRDGRASRLRRMTSRVIVELSRLLLIRDFYDYTSGFAVVRREVLEAIPLRGDYGEYFIDFIVRAHRRGFRITEVPYEVRPRREGESKTEVGFIGKGLKYLATVVRLRVGG